MKKSLLLLIALSLTLVACGADNDVESEIKKDDKQETELVSKPTENNEDESKSETKSDPDKEDVGENTFTLIPLDEFITSYNNLASLTDELKPLMDSEPKDESNTQILLNDDTYAILSIFDENDEPTSYSVGITQKDSYEEMKGNGLYATLNVATALDLDSEKLTEEFEISLEKEAHTYFDNGHMIMIENHKSSGKSGLGMLVQFMKFVDEE